MLEPDNQKIYFTTDDLSKVYPDAADAELTAMDVIEAENSYIIVDGEQMAIGYDEAKDAVLVLVSNESDDTLSKARQLLQLFVDNELFTSREIDGENGYIPDGDYPYSVNIADGTSARVVSYYPSADMFYPTEVSLWSGRGYTTTDIYVEANSSDAEGALEEAVATAEKIGWTDVLLDTTEVEKDMAADGHYNPETGEGDAVFNETYLYVDATMAGASQPYYVYSENFGVRPNENIKIK